jgi:GNAT superfamily N-acetyltransferase
VRVRPAAPEDVAAIEQIVANAYAVYIERIGMRPGPMDDDYVGRVDDGLVWVADDPDVVGLIVLVGQSESLLIENVAVDPVRQGEGIGRKLLAFAEAEALRNGFPQLTLYTHEKMSENLAFYARLGYSVDERRQEAGFARVFLSKQSGADPAAFRSV